MPFTRLFLQLGILLFLGSAAADFYLPPPYPGYVEDLATKRNIKLDINDIKCKPEFKPLVNLSMYDNLQSQTFFNHSIISATVHTMQAALLEYGVDKLPKRYLYCAIMEGIPVRIVGIYDDHFVDYVRSKRGWSVASIPSWSGQKSGSPLHSQRMKLWLVAIDGKQHIFITVIPGYEYLLHTTKLVHQYALRLGVMKPLDLELCYFPDAFYQLPVWSGLRQIDFRNQIVIVGYVEQLAKELASRVNQGKLLLASEGYCAIQNSPFIYIRFITKSHSYLLLGLTHSYWGKILSLIAKDVVSRGAVGFLHIGKSATFHYSMLESIIAPDIFITSESNHWKSKIFYENFFHRIFDSSGCHVSVPDVVGETYDLKKKFMRHGAVSLDCELSYLAQALKFMAKPDFFLFGAVHVVSDYLYSEECILQHSKDLLRSVASDSLNSLMKKICDYLESDSFNEVESLEWKAKEVQKKKTQYAYVRTGIKKHFGKPQHQFSCLLKSNGSTTSKNTDELNATLQREGGVLSITTYSKQKFAYFDAYPCDQNDIYSESNDLVPSFGQIPSILNRIVLPEYCFAYLKLHTVENTTEKMSRVIYMSNFTTQQTVILYSNIRFDVYLDYKEGIVLAISKRSQEMAKTPVTFMDPESIEFKLFPINPGDIRSFWKNFAGFEFWDDYYVYNDKIVLSVATSCEGMQRAQFLVFDSYPREDIIARLPVHNSENASVLAMRKCTSSIITVKVLQIADYSPERHVAMESFFDRK